MMENCMCTTNKDCATQCDAWRELDPHLTDEIKGALAASNRHLRAEQMGVDYLFDIHRVLMREGALIVAARAHGPTSTSTTAAKWPLPVRSRHC